jgi:hypothetical protein
MALKSLEASQPGLASRVVAPACECCSWTRDGERGGTCFSTLSPGPTRCIAHHRSWWPFYPTSLALLRDYWMTCAGRLTRPGGLRYVSVRNGWPGLFLPVEVLFFSLTINFTSPTTFLASYFLTPPRAVVHSFSVLVQHPSAHFLA